MVFKGSADVNFALPVKEDTSTVIWFWGSSIGKTRSNAGWYFGNGGMCEAGWAYYDGRYQRPAQ